VSFRFTVFGVFGAVGHGKNQVADHLATKGFRPYEIADPLKEMVSDVYGVPREICYGTQGEKLYPLDGRTVTTARGVVVLLPVVQRADGTYWTTRALLEFLGTDAFRSVDPETWVKLAARKIAAIRAAAVDRDDREGPVRQGAIYGLPCRGVVIPGVRFPNEEKMIRGLGGQLIRVIALGAPEQSGGSTHESNTIWETLTPDHVISVPYGRLDLLRARVDEVIGA
jgi:hypothetical protein